MERPTIVVGVVLKSHGLRGEVTVQSRSDNPDRWTPGAVVFDEDGTSYRVTAARVHGTRLLVSLDGIADRTAADALRGREMLIPESWLPELPDGEWWPHQLEGCRMVTERGRELGVLSEVIANPANDLWVAVDETGSETLVPVLKDLLIEVDIPGKRIVVRDVPGLTIPEGA
ncbi:MAG TPA: ribosome maturation factor RimM [Actinomycetota bacterium]